MDVYMVILCVGFGGMLLMALLGLHHGTHVRGGHTHHGLPSAGHLHRPGRGAPLKGKIRAGGKGGGLAHLMAGLISPVVIFSLLLGFGATGVLMRPLAAHWPLFLLPLIAVAGAGLFERCLVLPFWNFLFGFASTPARTLESLVLEEGRAVTNFDASGHGLIVVDLDGQVRQLLGNLAPEERTAGERVRSGDRLFIRAVDTRRNSCTVSRLD
jgi:hypothetical protein